MAKQPKDLIDLAHCNAYQTTNDGVKSDWLIRKNITGEELGQLPSHLSEEVIFQILHFARKYELIALNAGIQFQKQHQNAILREENRILKANLQGAIKRTEQLSELLEKYQLNGEA